MRLLVRCLPALTGIRNRDDAVFDRSNVSAEILPVSFCPLPKSARPAVYGNAHVCLPSSERLFAYIDSRRYALDNVCGGDSYLICILSESLIGGECHNHQDDKNGNDERWNKPGCHGSCLFAKNSSVAPTVGVLQRFTALQSPAKRFAFDSCAGVK